MPEGSRRERYKVLITASASKLAIVIAASFFVLLVLNVPIAAIFKMEGFAGIIPFFSLIILVPFVKMGVISALKFGRDHSDLRIGDPILVDGKSVIFKDLTLSSIIVRNSLGDNTSIAFNDLSRVTNMSSRHSWPVEVYYEFDINTPSIKLEEVRNSLREVLERDEEKYYFGVCELGDVRQCFAIKVVYLIRLAKEG